MIFMLKAAILVSIWIATISSYMMLDASKRGKVKVAQKLSVWGTLYFLLAALGELCYWYTLGGVVHFFLAMAAIGCACICYPEIKRQLNTT